MGVILYMLVTGRAPFQEANDSETLTMILDCKYYLPPNLSPECIELITRMLVRNPEKRIHLDAICNHQWFNDLHESSSSEDLSDLLTSSDDENLSFTDYQFNNKNNSNNNQMNDVNSYRRSKTKSREKLLKMVSLVKRENLSEKQNDEIISFMVSGNISTRDEIIK